MSSEGVKICDVSEDAKKKIKAFKRKQATSDCALILKIDKQSMMVIVDDELEDLTLDELREELPEHQPRYILYLYKNTHSDGRVSYPLCFIFVSPSGLNPEFSMMYAGSKPSLVKETMMTKIFECRDLEELTEEWLKTQLGIR